MVLDLFHSHCLYIIYKSSDSKKKSHPLLIFAKKQLFAISL